MTGTQPYHDLEDDAVEAEFKQGDFFPSVDSIPCFLAGRLYCDVGRARLIELMMFTRRYRRPLLSCVSFWSCDAIVLINWMLMYRARCVAVLLRTTATHPEHLSAGTESKRREKRMWACILWYKETIRMSIHCLGVKSKKVMILMMNDDVSC
jgi:hypothetical protein